MKKKLGVNIDHIATLRNARGGAHPDPIKFAKICEEASVDNITFHLREDRRHIKDADVRALKANISLPLNFEMACEVEMINLALKIQPHTVTFVPENRQELTTEGGLNLTAYTQVIKDATALFLKKNIHVSYFIDPDIKAVQQSFDMGATAVEFHTGKYARTCAGEKALNVSDEFNQLKQAARMASKLKLDVHAGHGLNLDNLKALSEIEQIESYQIGHALVGDAIFMGAKNAVLAYQHILS